MPLPLLAPALATGASALMGGALTASEMQRRKDIEKSEGKNRAVDKFYKSQSIEDKYGKKGQEISNRDMSSETEEADMLGARAKQQALVADIANREAGLEAPSLRNKNQARSFANQKATQGMKKGGAVKIAKGGSVSSASKRADGCAVRGKTKGRMI